MSRSKTDRIPFVRRAVVIASVLAASAATALAQAQEAYQPASDILRETLPASPLLYTAYALVWLVLVGYVGLLWRRLGRVERELRDVSARLGGASRPKS